MSAPRKPSAKPVRSGSGRPAGGDTAATVGAPRLQRGSSSQSRTATTSDDNVPFNAKEATDFLAARVYAAQDALRRYSDLPDEQRSKTEAPVVMYQGEQRAWGGTRPFNPIKDDFLQLVEIAVDAFTSSSATTD